MNDYGKKSCGSDCKHIKGINCAVKNCVYHDGESYCTAEHINVAPSNATSSTETACATFKLEGSYLSVTGRICVVSFFTR